MAGNRTSFHSNGFHGTLPAARSGAPPLRLVPGWLLLRLPLRWARPRRKGWPGGNFCDPSGSKKFLHPFKCVAKWWTPSLLVGFLLGT